MLSISKAMTVGTGELVGERRAPTIYVSSLVSFLLYLNVFLFTGLVSGSFEIVKLIFFVFFTLSAVLLSLLEGVKFKYLTLVLFLFLALVFVVHLSYSLVAGNYDQYSLVQFRNIIFVIVVLFVGFSLFRYHVVSYTGLAKILVFSSVFYLFIKLLIVLSLLHGADSVFVDFFAPNAIIYSNIGIPGIPRIVNANDFILPFAFLFAADIGLRSYYVRIVRVLLVVGILVSMTRYLWVSFFVVYFIDSVSNKKLIHFFVGVLVFVLSVILINNFTELKIVDAALHRVSVEGVSSVNTKYEQAELLLDESLKYPVLGKGMGAYLENYTRNERYKYIYEVFILALLMQLGIPLLLFCFFVLFFPIVYSVVINFNSRTLVTVISFCLFLMSGFTNPIILSSMSAFVYLVFYTRAYS